MADRVAGITHARTGMRFNDGRCDRQGRFWAGTMLMDMAAAARVGVLYRHDAGGGEPAAVLGDFIVPNGLGFSPDGRTMYLSDSHPSVQTVWAFDYDPDTEVLITVGATEAIAGAVVAMFMPVISITAPGGASSVTGEWKVNGVAHNPDYKYNPKLLVNQPKDAKPALLPPGPNGPVGVVWIDLNKEHYGIHGTPEPGHISRTQSSGCVRLTNFAAEAVASAVKAGTPVTFQE
mgnify:CR=1 FL=1